MSVVVQGHKEIRRKLRKMTNEVDKTAAKGELKRINKEVADIVKERAAQLIPVRTGTLRDTLRSGAAQTQSRVYAGFAKVPYAGPIHFGWAARNIRPQPFLYSALDQRREEVLQHYDQQLSRLIKDFGLD